MRSAADRSADRPAPHPAPHPAPLLRRWLPELRLSVSEKCMLVACSALLAACEPMSTGGELFGPAAGSELALGAGGSTAGAPGPGSRPADPAFSDFEEPAFKMSSDELHQTAQSGEKAKPPTPLAPVATAPSDAALPPPEPAVTPPAPAPPPAVGVENVLALQPGPWPVRLLRTLPETQPPRAILGLPDGREIVVSPGSMVPEQGLVVMAVGRDNLTLARITGQGDHVTVSDLQLQSQY